MRSVSIFWSLWLITLIPGTGAIRAGDHIGRYSSRKAHPTKAYEHRRYTFESQKDKKEKHHYAIYYKGRKNYIYFFNPRARRYWGRFDLEKNGYSLLPNTAKKEKLSDIPESAFLPPGEMPPPEVEMKAQMLPPPESWATSSVLPPPEAIGGEDEEPGRQFYTQWFKDEEKNRWAAHYYFKPYKDASSYQRQTILFYPQKLKAKYVYYFNEAKKKFWGRCLTKHHAAFRPDPMVWSFASQKPGDPWGPLTVGDPPIPGSNGKPKMKKYPEPLPELDTNGSP